MRGMNKVMLIGNTTRDAVLRQTKAGKPVANIRLATNRVIKGEVTTQYHTVICWNRLAETVAEHVKKGKPLFVEGRLEYRKVWPGNESDLVLDLTLISYYHDREMLNALVSSPVNAIDEDIPDLRNIWAATLN